MGFVSELLAKLVKKTVKEEPDTQGAFAPVVVPQEGTTLHAAGEAEEDGAERFAAGPSSGPEGGADEWGPFSSLATSPTVQSFEEFWYQLYRIEEAGEQGNAQLHAALSARGIRDNLHLHQIRNTFQRHFGHLHEFHQAVFSAKRRQGKEDLQRATNNHPGLFAPIDGIDLKTFATIQARMMRSGSAGPDAVRGILSSYNLTQEKWDVVNAQWLERMGDQTDPMATVALNGEYGKYFAEAGVN